MKPARTSLSIRIVTAVVLTLTAASCIAALWEPRLLPAAAILAGISLLCYLLAPVGYDVADGILTVQLRLGRRRFGPVIRCSRVTQRVPCSIRLFGNGGMFAGAGIFWNRSYGVYRAYVTSARLADLVLVETADRKILVSPARPADFVGSSLPPT